MTKTAKTNADGFALALGFYVDKNGRKFGAKTLMAKELGVSAPTVDSWDGVGIPRRHLENVSKKTGIPVEQLRPDPTK